MTRRLADRPEAGGGVIYGPASLPGRLERGMGIMIRLSLILSCICLASIILIGTIDTIGRLISKPLLSSTEMTEALLASAIFLALPMVQHYRAHVVVDILKQGFGARLRYASEIVSLLIATFVFFIMARQGLDGGIAAARAGEVSAGFLPIPIWIAKCVSAAGLILTVAESARQLVFFVIWPASLSVAPHHEPESIQFDRGE